MYMRTISLLMAQLTPKARGTPEVREEQPGIGPSQTFSRYLSGSKHFRSDLLQQLFESTLKTLEHPSINLASGHIALLMPFITLPVSDDLQALRSAIEAMPAPEGHVDAVLAASGEDGQLSPLLLERNPGLVEILSDIDLNHYRFDRVEFYVLGHFTSLQFVDFNGRISFDESGQVPDTFGTEELAFIVSLPKADPARGIAPPYKTVVFQHAFTVCKETVVAVADTLSAAGFASIGIDVINHGSRSKAGPGSCEIDPFEFIDLSDIGLSAYKFTQTVVDQFQLVQMLRQLDLDVLPAGAPDGVADMDTSDMGYLGQSMGSFMGAVFVALEPHISTAVFNVGGGGISIFFLGTMSEGRLQYPSYADTVQAMLSVFIPLQILVEPSDPANFGRHYFIEPFDYSFAGGPMNILLQEVYQDEVVVNGSSEHLMRAAGLQVMAPFTNDGPFALDPIAAPVSGNTAAGTTGVMSQFYPARHEFLLLNQTDEDLDLMHRGQYQAVEFLQTSLDSGVGVLLDPYDEVMWEQLREKYR